MNNEQQCLHARIKSDLGMLCKLLSCLSWSILTCFNKDVTMDFDLLIMTGITFLIAGLIKGLLGLGMPTTSITLLSFFISPLMAIAINLVPMFISNLWQFGQARSPRLLVRRYGLLAGTMMAAMLVSSFFTVRLGNHGLTFLIGLSVSFFALINIIGFQPKIADKHDRLAQIITGLISGGIGGATSLWGVPMTLYLIARHTKRDEFVDAMGFLLLLGCLPLFIGYGFTGLLDWANLWPFMLVGTLTGLFGFEISRRMREYLSPELFRKLLLWMFLAMGLRMMGLAILAWLN